MDIRQKAKEAGIKSWHLKSEETLREELKEIKEEQAHVLIKEAVELLAETEEQSVITPEPVAAPSPQAQTTERVQVQRNYERLGINRKDLQDYLNEGWAVASE